MPVRLPNMSNVSASDTDFPLIPKGWYPALVYEVKEEGPGPSGSKYLNWQFKLDGGEYDNRRVFDITSYSEKSIPFLKGRLMLFGVNVDDPDLELDLDELAGMECMVQIGHETYEGTTRERVAGVKKRQNATEAAAAETKMFE
jgi:hypothetical protein